MTTAIPALPDSSDPALLPAEAPLAMPEQNFAQMPAPAVHSRPPAIWIARAALFGGAAFITGAFAYELYGVLALERLTPVQFVFLVLSTIAFAWVALGTMSTAMGFLPLFADENADTIHLPAAEGGQLRSRTALLFPVYHEDRASIAGTIEAMAADIHALACSEAFDIFILSDTRGDAVGNAEEAAYRALRNELSGVVNVYYRRRRNNAARKAGNIKDWVERFGSAYAHFVILDGDSVMSGSTLVRLARAMERDANAGLIQTVPKLAGGTTLLQRLQQFAAHVYGPSVAAGLAFWHRDQGNYWGHNAIIRTRAFAAAAGLPALPGKAPFGGHIQSHDFVEAVLLQRAGYGVHMAPALQGSYEGLPPTLQDLIVRDRRWAQGNLQHLSIVGAGGLTPMGRVHLTMGAMSYLVSAIWAASLAVGVVLALQSQQIIPSYFEDSKTLFPIWPVIDPGAAMRLFLATMAVVMLPKVLGLVLEIKRVWSSREVGGTLRAVGGVMVETVFSMLLAPILMVTQTAAVAEIFMGRDSGWRAQQRADGRIALADAMRFHVPHTVIGLVLAAICYWASPGLLAWMSPVLLGLLLAGPVSWLVAQPAGKFASIVLSTPEDRTRPAILERAERGASEWREQIAFGQHLQSQRDLPRAA